MAPGPLKPASGWGGPSSQGCMSRRGMGEPRICTQPRHAMVEGLGMLPSLPRQWLMCHLRAGTLSS